MTCYLCEYEFCWACGASASMADRHFVRGRGCGAAMLDENVRAYDHTKLDKTDEKRPVWKTVLIVVSIVLAAIILLPLVIVFFVPVNCAFFLS